MFKGLNIQSNDVNTIERISNYEAMRNGPSGGQGFVRCNCATSGSKKCAINRCQVSHLTYSGLSGAKKLICIDEFFYTLNLEMSLWNLCLEICIDQEKPYLKTRLTFSKRGFYFEQSCKKAIFMRLMMSS